MKRWRLILNEPWLERCSTGQWVTFEDADALRTKLMAYEADNDRRALHEAELAQQVQVYREAQQQSFLEGFGAGKRRSAEVVRQMAEEFIESQKGVLRKAAARIGRS